MSSEGGKKKSMLKAFKPKKPIEIGPDEPSPEGLANSITAAVPQAAAGPRMFAKIVKQEKVLAPALAPAPAPAPRKNTTSRANRPKPAFLIAPGPAPAPAEAKQSKQSKASINDMLAEITGQAVVELPARGVVPQVALEDLERSAPCRRDKAEEVFLLPRVVVNFEAQDDDEMPLMPKKVKGKSGVTAFTKKAALLQAAAETTQDSRLKKIERAIKVSTAKDPYQDAEPDPYYPEDRKGFTRFIATRFKTFLLPDELGKKIDENACSKMELKTYAYQAFIREYMRQASPYRGVLVYHGLGSGKTCTAIAASEALYAQDNKKIIVMTPTSLKENFLNEIMFCGFRHFRLKNVWRSFDLTNAANRLFAESVAGIPEKLINSILRRSEERHVFWMPDLNEPESKSNFDDLEDWQRSAIREQLYEVIQKKFTFIGYTGVTYDFLKNIEQNDPTFFDNAIVVVDEVHNLTRLMVGKLDKYYAIKKSMTAAKARGDEAKFQKRIRSVERAYLFYKFLTEAKNTKIIALSGTPIVNQPTEIGILANVLHGYFHSVRDAIASTDDKVIAKAKAVLKAHPRVNYYSITKAEGTSALFFTILDEGYIKIFDDTTGELQGILYAGVDEAEPVTIQDLYTGVTAELKAAGVTLTGRPEYKDLPLMPPTVEEFMDNFIDPIRLEVKNPITFAKRMSGLVSYYRGSKEELMPRVTIDEQVPCPFEAALSQNQYTIARVRELEQESKKKKKPAFSEAMDLAESENSSYRFRSRAACNFAFPSDIERPYPKKKSDLKKAVGVSKSAVYEGAIDLGEDDTDLATAELAEIKQADAEEEAIADEGDDDLFSPAADADAAGAAAGGKRTHSTKTYEQELREALETLYARKDELFQIDATLPENQQLKTYSSKFAEIITRINASKGSSLVYSTFKTVEGIGVLGYALEANGFAPIQIEGPENNLRFTEETEKAILENPEQPRFIIYSGEQTVRERQTLINIFNCRMDKLPAEITRVLREAGFDDKPAAPAGAAAGAAAGGGPASVGNMRGDVCRAFMITGAGAEGLSLKNVRTVHIMEPYWNKVRTDQVKGRAVRICSHADLPWDERTVEVYTYLAMLNKKLDIVPALQINDDSESSDQYILKLAETKEQVNSSIIALMKAGSVDCIINKADNEKDIRCLIQEGSINDFLYDPRIDADIKMTEQGVRVETGAAAGAGAGAGAGAAKAVGRGVKFKGITYKLIVDPKTKKELIYGMDDPFFGRPLGELQVNAATKKASLKFYE